MSIPNRKESILLLAGDLVAFVLSLWLALALRSASMPSTLAFVSILTPFSILFVLWIFAFFIAGLYEKQRIVRRSRLPELLLKTQVWNSFVAILFFYTVPYFGVEPKTILFLYIIISLVLTFLWRVFALSFFDVKHRERAMLIGGGVDADEVKDEVNANSRIAFEVISHVDTSKMGGIDFARDILERIKDEDISIIIVDSQDQKVVPILPELYELMFSKVKFLDLYALYEDIFDRVPISLLQHGWFVENISLSPHAFYDALKRAMDVMIALIILVFTAFIALPIWIALRIEGVNRFWSFQERVGQYGKTIRLMKFPTMLYDDNGNWKEGRVNKVTKVGAFLRKTRLDEFPQAWNLLKGDVSLIGPRSEFAKAVAEYAKEIPYYSARFMVRPGLSGWAQIYGEHPHHGIDINATRNKLSYDLFYIKYRSFALDVVIALKTIKTMISIEGI